tara:strand:+ start:14147 stop:14578 length:432 start_codon:yes stop_codon:yes gene_type:complete
MGTEYFDYRAGLGNVGSYQASARPFLSSSIYVSGNLDVVKIRFPNVTRFVTIKNTVSQVEPAVGLRVGISNNGINGIENNNYLTLYNEESYSADWRIKDLHLKYESTEVVVGYNNVTASVIAGLTNIQSGELEHNWSGSEGVG